MGAFAAFSFFVSTLSNALTKCDTSLGKCPTCDLRGTLLCDAKASTERDARQQEASTAMNENLRQRPLLSNPRHCFLDMKATAAINLLFEAPDGTRAAKTLTAIVDRRLGVFDDC